MDLQIKYFQRVDELVEKRSRELQEFRIFCQENANIKGVNRHISKLIGGNWLTIQVGAWTWLQG